MSEYKRIPVDPVEYDEDGQPIFNLASDAANEDWIRAARLKRKADAGDQEAAERLRQLEEAPTFTIKED